MSENTNGDAERLKQGSYYSIWSGSKEEIQKTIGKYTGINNCHLNFNAIDSPNA